jgi:MFS family permease
MGLVAMTFALALAVFMVGVDINIISTAIPQITADFDSVDEIGWFGSAFLMTACAFQILWGRLYTLLPAKWVFVASIVVFEIGSLICGASNNDIAFIIGRAVQGIGVAGMLSGALIIMSLVVPLAKRGLLGGIIGAMEGVAMISAPLIGGVLTDKASWRWCFYINLPIGAVVLVVVLIFLRLPPQPMSPEIHYMTPVQRILSILSQLDLVGTAFLVPAIVCVLLALQLGGIKYPWGSLAIVLLFILSALLFGIFVFIQRQRKENAMIPSRILKNRTVLASFWFMLCTSSGLVVITYFVSCYELSNPRPSANIQSSQLPLWFQTIRSDSPSESGVHMLPMLLGVIVAVLASGVLVTAVGYYTPIMILGTILMSVGSGLMSTFSPSTSAALRILYPAFFGLGVGSSFQMPTIATQTVLSDEDIPLGTTVIVFGQSFGAAIVLSIANSVFTNHVTDNIEAILGPVAGASPESLLNSITGGKSDDSLLKLISEAGGSADELVNALNGAIRQTFYVAVAMAAMSILGAVFVEWRSVKKPNGATQDDMPPLMKNA